MNPKQSTKPVNRDGCPDSLPVEPSSASLFDRVAGECDRSDSTPPLSAPGGAASVPPEGLGDTIAQAAGPVPELDPEPFDLDSILRAKQAQGKQELSPDPFDISRLKLPQDFASAFGFKRVVTTIHVGKPGREWFVRTHPDPSYQLQTMILELKDDRECYLVMPELWGALADEPTCGPRLILAAVNRKGVPFLWTLRLPGPDGKLDNWSQSAMDAATRARAGWVRMTANMAIMAYEVFVAQGPLEEPEWPDLTFRQMLEIGFRDKVISTLDHPVLRKLRGEI